MPSNVLIMVVALWFISLCWPFPSFSYGKNHICSFSLRPLDSAPWEVPEAPGDGKATAFPVLSLLFSWLSLTSVPIPGCQESYEVCHKVFWCPGQGLVYSSEGTEESVRKACFVKVQAALRGASKG